MKLKSEYRLAKLALFTLLLVFATNMTSIAYAQQTQSKTSVDYIQNARSLLKQVSTEYKNGNYAKAEELAGTAYLDNFEYVEADLQKRGQSDLVEELEKMMVTDLRGMIRDKISQEQLDNEIAAIDAKLAQAQVIVPEFAAGVTISMVTIIAIGSIIGFTRIKSHSGSNLRLSRFW